MQAGQGDGIFFFGIPNVIGVILLGINFLFDILSIEDPENSFSSGATNPMTIMAK